ncbi:nonsense-mediated mRNA decay factor SMG9-like [Amphiura filiformis]|uniref:nonsense-mediated mRNA decay factor SMG9-like n=1 Tax=Amphiura filiformis TaxID=82378 RepID=UPI003B214818
MATPGSGAGGGGGGGGSARGGRRRRRRGGRDPKHPTDDIEGDSVSSTGSKTPVILAKHGIDKHGKETGSQDFSMTPGTIATGSQDPSGSGMDQTPTPHFKIKTRQGERGRQGSQPDIAVTVSKTSVMPSKPGAFTIATTKASTPSTPSMTVEAHASPMSSGTPGQQSVHQVMTRHAGTPQVLGIEVPVHNRLALPPEMTQTIKLVDEAFHWCDNAMETLQDQSDFLVIGVLGLQGSGKSTVMSLLTGTQANQPHSSYIFKPQNADIQEQAGHQTRGIDFFVTPERIILLDTQPVLSASMLDYLMGHEKTLPPEMTSAENYAEIQSLQLAAFLFTVCHAVIVVQDWFVDINLIEFLKRAEMLKPPTPSPGPKHDESSVEETEDYFPNIVFVQNRANHQDFELQSMQAMQQTLDKLFKDSKLNYKGCASLSHCGIMAGINRKLLPLDVNLFLLPTFNSHINSKEDPSTLMSLLPSCYQGYPSTELLVKSFRNQMYGATRTQLTHATLTEKNWFHYAARTWEAIKKSSLMSEFNRLLS